jgi:hypothetical protein
MRHLGSIKRLAAIFLVPSMERFLKGASFMSPISPEWGSCLSTVRFICKWFPSQNPI